MLKGIRRSEMVRFLDLSILRRHFVVWLVDIYAFHCQRTRLYFHPRQSYDCPNLYVRSGFLPCPCILFRQKWRSMAISCGSALLSDSWLCYFDWV